MAIVTLNEHNFADITQRGTVVIDFYADWCGPCRAMAPRLEAFANNHGDVIVAKLDVDAFPALAQKHDVRSIPTLLVYRDGVAAQRIVGLADARQLEALVTHVAATG